jgi:AcrR family transcriptional regulator
MYQLFESKDELLAASLKERASAYVARLLPAADDGLSPRERILHVFAQVESQAGAPVDQHLECLAEHEEGDLVPDADESLTSELQRRLRDAIPARRTSGLLAGHGHRTPNPFQSPRRAPSLPATTHRRSRAMELRPYRRRCEQGEKHQAAAIWAGEGRRRKHIAELAGVCARTVDRTRTRYAESGVAGAESGVAGLVERKRGGGKEQVPPQTRSRVIALTRMTPPPEPGLQALDRTQPVLPVAFATTEKRTHDYARHGTTNLFAALNIATGEVVGECKPNRNGANFLAFLKKAVKPHAGKEIHVVLDNLSTHTTPDVKAWLEKNPHVDFRFTPAGSSWLNRIEIRFGIITRQSIRRGTFATTGEILAKVRLVTTSVPKFGVCHRSSSHTLGWCRRVQRSGAGRPSRARTALGGAQPWPASASADTSAHSSQPLIRSA